MIETPHRYVSLLRFDVIWIAMRSTASRVVRRRPPLLQAARRACLPRRSVRRQACRSGRRSDCRESVGDSDDTDFPIHRLDRRLEVGFEAESSSLVISSKTEKSVSVSSAGRYRSADVGPTRVHFITDSRERQRKLVLAGVVVLFK
jgi:hypothetical protein